MRFSAILLLLAAGSSRADSWNNGVSGAIYPTVATTKFAVGFTGAPTYKSELRGHATGNLFQVLKLSTAGTSHITLSASPGGASNYFVINSNGGANGIIFSTGSPDGNSGLGTERMRILSSGNVAIGATSAPAESKLVLGPQTGNSFEGGQLQLNGAGTYPAGFVDNVMDFSSGQPMLRFLSGSNAGSSTLRAYLGLNTGEFRVFGDVNAQRFVVNGTWSIEVPDYVFKPGYRLKSLEETEKFVRKNRHLPEMPNARELKKEGMNLAEMNLRLLKQVEELTLHAIDQNKRIKALEQRASR